ncbi:MAG: glycosyltransferase [Candidatus Wallbacteria bacterium]|nr:glycosyltransferase [Candidatus Wallbacteria bacterium]
MRVLVSAYACGPGSGSEPGVGWGWALGIAERGHEVCVVTRHCSRESIEAWQRAGKGPVERLEFLYYDLPGFDDWWLTGGFGTQAYYVFWQWGAARLALQAHKRKPFDLVHHVTLATVRQPSFLWRLGRPLWFGPVGGGEVPPRRLRRQFSLGGWLWESFRELWNRACRYDPLLRLTLSHADRIYVTSPQSRGVLPPAHRERAEVMPTVGLDPRTGSRECCPPRQSQSRPGALEVLFAGRFVAFKGLSLGLDAFARHARRFPGSRLTLVGQGPEEAHLKEAAVRLGVEKDVEFVRWLPRSELCRLYRESDVFFFPSLGDSGGMVLLEAMAHGLPVVCLALGGPAILADSTCGRVVAAEGLPAATVADGLAGALDQLASSEELLHALALGAPVRAAHFHWPRVVARVYAEAA